MMLNLEPLTPHLPVWAMVVFRLAGIFFFAPVLGSSAIPARVKIFLVLGMSFCVYPTLLAPGSPTQAMLAASLNEGLSLWTIVPSIGAEILIGLSMGLAASLPLLGLQIAGQIADQQMGLGLAGIFNPEMGEDAGAMGQFYFMLALALFLIVPPGGHRVLLGTLVDSFGHVPLGGFRIDGDFVRLFTGLLTASFDLAIRISAPLLCLIFLETIALGFIARTVPQMNILSVGFPLRIMVGMTVVIGAVHIKAAVFIESLHSALASINAYFTGG